MAAILSKALEFHGFISVLSPGKYNGEQEADWKTLGADFTALGQYRISHDTITLELKLLNVSENRMIFGRRYSGPLQKHDKMVLKFCDEVIRQLTGEPGISLSKITFVSDKSGFKEIYVADVLGEEIRQVTKHRNLAVSPSFSPDGRLLTYTSYHRGNPNLYITDLSQSEFTKAFSRRKGLNLAPAWAPNGKMLAVTLSKDGNPDLYLMDDQGEIIRRLTFNSGINVSPSWSPDGTRLAFVSDRSGGPQVYVMNLKDNTCNRITYLGNDNTEPSWSPKGDWITYAGLYEGSYHIFIIKPDGSSPTRLTKYYGNHESPSWSPDGQQIVFSRQLDNQQKLYVVLKNGMGLRPLFHPEEGSQSSPQWSSRLIF